MKTEQIGIRIDQKTKEELKKIAKSQKRSLSNLIEWILHNHLISRVPKSEK